MIIPEAFNIPPAGPRSVKPLGGLLSGGHEKGARHCRAPCVICAADACRQAAVQVGHLPSGGRHFSLSSKDWSPEGSGCCAPGRRAGLGHGTGRPAAAAGPGTAGGPPGLGAPLDGD